MITISKPERHQKTWGYEDWIVNNQEQGYCGKILVFEPKLFCSMHFHINKHETFQCLTGIITINLILADGKHCTRTLHPGDILTITPGLMHQIINTTDTQAQLLEISTFHEDNDSYRVSRDVI